MKKGRKRENKVRRLLKETGRRERKKEIIEGKMGERRREKNRE